MFLKYKQLSRMKVFMQVRSQIHTKKVKTNEKAQQTVSASDVFKCCYVTIFHTRPYLQLQRQGEALCPTPEAPESLSQAVDGRHLVLRAQACPGHEGARTQQHMVTTSKRLWEV